MSTRLLLIRHGETDWNVEGRYQGQADPPLNERGRAQARRLAASPPPDPSPDLIVSSPLARALETARILGTAWDVPVTTEARFQEIHQGDWQGRLRGEIQRLYPDLFSAWEHRPWEVSPPGGESMEEVNHRVMEALSELLREQAGRTVALVTHRIPLALIKMRHQGLDPDALRTLDIPNTRMEELVFDEFGNLRADRVLHA